MSDVDEAGLRERVQQERRLRGYLSGRAAAETARRLGARISYTTWNDWESGARPLGDAMRKAIMMLFDWPVDWPENPPPVEPASDAISQLRAELDRQRDVTARLALVVEWLLARERDELQPGDERPPAMPPVALSE